MGQIPSHQHAAALVAVEVGDAQDRGQWVMQRTVNWLLDQFGCAHLDTFATDQIGNALRDVGIKIEPALSEQTQSGSISRSLADRSEVASPPPLRRWAL